MYRIKPRAVMVGVASLIYRTSFCLSALIGVVTLAICLRSYAAQDVIAWADPRRGAFGCSTSRGAMAISTAAPSWRGGVPYDAVLLVHNIAAASKLQTFGVRDY